jgi:hypothetical protein
MLIKHRVEKIDMNKFDDYVNAYVIKRPQVVLSDLEFPSLSSTLEDYYKKQIVIPNLGNEDEALSILEKETTFYFKLPTNCKLIGILAYITAPSWESTDPLFYHDSQCDGKFNLLPVFKTGILKDINNKESVHIRIVFKFEYSNKTFKVRLCEYSISKRLRMQFTMPETGKATVRVKTNASDYISFEQVVHNELG